MNMVYVHEYATAGMVSSAMSLVLTPGVYSACADTELANTRVPPEKRRTEPSTTCVRAITSHIIRCLI